MFHHYSPSPNPLPSRERVFIFEGRFIYYFPSLEGRG
jgi:hypothetical protein